MQKSFDQLKYNAIQAAVGLMAASARTAPKSKGKDDIEIKYFDGRELKKAVTLMSSEEFIKSTIGKREFFMDSDVHVLKEAEGVLAIGVQGKKPMQMNCGKCGYKDCATFCKALTRKRDATCAFKLLDLGFAASSACKVAADLNIDNRVMYDIGEALRRLYMSECDMVLGIALSIKGHNIFVDRYLRFFVQKARAQNVSVDKLLKEYGIRTHEKANS